MMAGRNRPTQIIEPAPAVLAAVLLPLGLRRIPTLLADRGRGTVHAAHPPSGQRRVRTVAKQLASSMSFWMFSMGRTAWPLQQGQYSESRPGSHRRVGGCLCSRFAAWFPGGATRSRPSDGSFPAPRRTGLGVLHHPAPSLSRPPRDGVEVVNDPRRRKHGLDDRVEALPGQRATLAAPVEPFEQ